MEVEGRKHDETSLNKEDTIHYCIPCKADEIDTLADGVCEECDEYMCNPCFRHHRKARFCKDHSFIDLDKYTDESSGRLRNEQLEKCEEHNEGLVKFYCVTHDKVGCGECIVRAHRSCNIEDISEKATGFETSDDFKTFIKEVKYCRCEITAFRSLSLENGKKYERMLSKCSTDIETFRSEINAWLNEQEMIIKEQIEKVRVLVETDANDVETKCEDLSNDMLSIEQVFAKLSKQESNLFIGVVRNRKMLKAIKIRLESLYSAVSIRSYAFRRNSDIEQLISGGCAFGTVESLTEFDQDPKNNPQASKKERPEKVDDEVDKEVVKFKGGDKVRIEIDIDVLKMIEDNRGAWNDHMTECIGKTGIVLVSKGNDITVDFKSAGRWTFHESVLSKVLEFVPGEVVKVNDSADHVIMLQTYRGGWHTDMVKVIGKRGTVEEVDEDGDVQVGFGDYTWIFNPECLSPSDGNADILNYTDEVSSGLKPPVDLK